MSTSKAGGANIAASYSGDSNNYPSGGGTTLGISPAVTSTTVVCAPAALIVGQQSTCSATVTGFNPTGIVTWQSSDSLGIFSANPCTLSAGSCGIAYTATTSAIITATYEGDGNNTASHGTFSISASVNEKIQITVANSGPATAVSLSGCSVSPTSIQANGMPQTFQAASGCTGITLTLPPPGVDSQYLTASGQGSLTIGSCSSSSCQTFSATIYYQVMNTYQAIPASPSSWSSPGSMTVNGTQLGQAGQTVCKISVTAGAGKFSCQGWSDYQTQVTMGVLQVSTDQRWATNQTAFIDTTGGNTYNSSYYSQVLEDFQYSLVGSTTAPSAPGLSYTSFGTKATFPLTGLESLVWLDTGSSWSVPASLQGSTSSERWQSPVTSGAATAGQTVELTYYHQYLVDFGFTVSGGGTAYAPPTIGFTSFGAPSTGAQGWVDAGTTYSYTDPLAGSTVGERWYTPVDSGIVSTPGAISPLYYHQFTFALNFTVSGGGVYDDPAYAFTSLGTPAAEQLNSTKTTFWVDAGSPWSVDELLPSSTSGERWITTQEVSGTVSSAFQEQFLYYHQYLATLQYSISGSGGSPPVPSMNFTTYSTTRASKLSTSPGAFWMDSQSQWQVPLTLPGVRGERWLSNVTGAVTIVAPVKLDVQYAHQFYVEVGVSTAAGGHVANTNQWENQLSDVVLNATTEKLWSFAYWQGGTPFSYNGTTRLPTLTVTGPANETAVFFPGLTIFTNSLGSVNYSFGIVNGTVAAGSNATIYPAPGKNVTIIAVPNDVDIKFTGWTGQVLGTQLPSSLEYKLRAWTAIDSPSTVQASFAVDYTDIRTFAIATIAVFIAACFVFVIRRGFTPKIKRT